MKRKVLITGGSGFTGQYLAAQLRLDGFAVYDLDCDLCDARAVQERVDQLTPEYVVHLAAISFPAHEPVLDFYKINVLGTKNLLEALAANAEGIKKILLCSSAAVYGNQDAPVLDEKMCPRASNHYAMSKLNTELMAQNYINRLPIVLVRPFNYTGPGQPGHFLIPKIVDHFKSKSTVIELGNLDVKREFNDIRDVVRIYTQMLVHNGCDSEVVNIASQTPVSLMEVIEQMQNIAGYEIEVRVNPAFVRKNEIKSLCGSSEKLRHFIREPFTYRLRETLEFMYTS